MLALPLLSGLVLPSLWLPLVRGLTVVGLIMYWSGFGMPTGELVQLRTRSFNGWQIIDVSIRFVSHIEKVPY